MSYADTYFLDCDNTLPSYTSSCCGDREYGRVRSVAFIRKSYLPQILSNPEDIAIWQTGIGNGSIIIIPETSGTFDGGEPLKLKGYGTRIATNGPREMTLDFFDPNYSLNYQFYAALEKQTDLVVAFRTSSLIHIGSTKANIVVKENVEDDLESEMAWQCICKMVATTLPMIVESTSLLSLFSCSNTIPINQNHILALPGLQYITALPGGERITHVP